MILIAQHGSQIKIEQNKIQTKHFSHFLYYSTSFFPLNYYYPVK